MLTIFRYFQSLAHFHALCIALRRNKPDEFREHIAPNLLTINVYAVDEERQINKVVSKYCNFSEIKGLKNNPEPRD